MYLKAKPKSIDDVHISQELVDVLNLLIPERCPDILDTERHIWIYTGERNLVKKINKAFQRQQNKGVNQDVFST